MVTSLKILINKYHVPRDIINYKLFLPKSKMKHKFNQFFRVNYQITEIIKDRGT